MTITRRALFIILTLYTAIAGVLSRSGINPWGLAAIVGLSYLLLVPGLLLALSLRLRASAASEYVVQVIGLSLAYLLFLGLVVNTVLPKMGVMQPLATGTLLGAVAVSLTVLAASAWWHSYHLSYRITFYRPRRHEIGLLAMAGMALLLSIAGAHTLNNHGSALWTLLSLALGVGLVVLAVVWRRKLQVDSWAGLVFLLALSLLLMTSLRGWYITGHDIAREYQVFQLTARFGQWSISRYQDAYNACLSITILPTMLRNLLHVPDLYIYKILYQIIFAICPVTVFLTVRRFAGMAIAWLATIYFLAFPTFFGDMPMLARQEIAFVFLALMLLQLAKQSRDARQARFLLAVYGLGMVVSHYSTTYSVILVFGLALFVRWFLRLFAQMRHPGQAVTVAVTGMKRTGKRQLVTPWLVALLAASSFVWSIQLTHTGGGAIKIVQQTVSAITGAVKNDLKSSDVNYSLFSHHHVDPQAELTSYVARSTATAQARNATSAFFPGASSVALSMASTAELPLTGIGRGLTHLGLNVARFNLLGRQLTAFGLQLLIVIGLVGVIWRRRYVGQIHLEYLSLAIATLGFVILQVVLPLWSVEYGLLRAFQQSLMLLGVFAVIGSLVLTRYTRRSWKVSSTQLLFAAGVAAGFMASTTGLLTQLTGGYSPQLHLNNAGAYYDLYYTHAEEIVAAQWLAAIRVHDPKSTTQSDRFNFTKIQTPSEQDDQNDIIPPLVRRDAYVFLGYDNVRHGQSTISYNGDLVSYIYPQAFLDQNKDLIYANGSSEIYR